MVVVSPLMRALETAAGAFGAGAFKGEGRPLMLSQTEDLDERAPHGAVACPEGIPFIAFEGCRERLGVYAQHGLVLSRAGLCCFFRKTLLGEGSDTLMTSGNSRP